VRHGVPSAIAAGRAGPGIDAERGGSTSDDSSGSSGGQTFATLSATALNTLVLPELS
jgi:hypothetical protein